MIKVKVSLNAPNRNVDLFQYTGNHENILDNVKFYVNTEEKIEFDFWFVLDNVPTFDSSAIVASENIFFFTSEQIHPIDFYLDKQSFLIQFNKAFSNYHLPGIQSQRSIPFLPWMINSNHGSSILEPNIRNVTELAESRPQKSKLLSLICSNKVFTPEQRLRLSFSKSLKNHFGSDLDWFGNGVNDLPRKWDGIAPYRFHIVLENTVRNFIMTEKLFDSYLGLSFPFYWGAPNVNRYFSSKSFISIDINNFKESINIIEKGINRNYDALIPHLIESREKVIHHYNLFQRLKRIAIDHFQEYNDNRKTFNKLKPYRNRKIF